MELNYIVTAESNDVTTVVATYAKAIDATILTLAAFASQPTSEIPGAASNLSPTEVQLDFDNPITGDEVLQYTGSDPGLLTPQDVTYT